jgi:hypothetical protein
LSPGDFTGALLLSLELLEPELPLLSLEELLPLLPLLPLLELVPLTLEDFSVDDELLLELLPLPLPLSSSSSSSSLSLSPLLVGASLPS